MSLVCARNYISYFFSSELVFKHHPTFNLRHISTIGNSPSTEFQIPVPWGHVAAKRWGRRNGKPVLAVHGWQDNAGSFDPLAPLLPNHWDLVCIDLPGHGLSSHYETGHVYFEHGFVGDIVRVLKFLNWTKFDYIGHSFGSGLGMLFASIFPDKINYLVSLDLIKAYTAPNSSPVMRKAWRNCCEERLRFEDELNKPPPSYSMEEAIEKWYLGANKSLTRESIKILFKRGVKILPDGKVEYTRDRRNLLPIPSMVLASLEQYYVFIAFMKCHFLIIKGKPGAVYEPDDVYQKAMEIYKKNCKSFTYVEIEGTHHFHLNNPERVSEYIRNFIK